MKIFCLLFLVLSGFCAFPQLSFPKDFHLDAGENLSGEDDVYTNGKYAFSTHKLFRDYDFKRNDEGVKKLASDFFNFPFYITSDGLCWGTGKGGGIWSYVVITWDGEVIELSSQQNDEGFVYYSKWLLSTIRTYHKEGKLIMFPIRSN